MDIRLIAIFLLMPGISAQIQVNIVASDDEQERSVSAAGGITDVISDQERDTFCLSDSNLKDAILKQFGARPDDAYVRSPTPWGDLYQTYNWPQVTRSLNSVRAVTLQTSFHPSIIKTQVFINNSSTTGKFMVKIYEEVENTVKSTWHKGGELTVSQTLVYGYDIKAVSVYGNTSFSYSSNWGESVSKSESVKVGSETGVEVTLRPHQSVTADLVATRGTMRVRVDYEATLWGSAAVNYAVPHEQHHFWGFHINSVMNAAGLNTSVASSEVIELGYYSNSKIIVKDSLTQKLILSVSA